ncbi:unnamed protein product [Symbiodinium sp. CCMP2456]|nr:unnamed protein product [Symbiodinium sp. CCMP2456]
MAESTAQGDSGAVQAPAPPRSRWLDGTTKVDVALQPPVEVTRPSPEPSNVPVKAKPSVPPLGFEEVDPWEGKTLPKTKVADPATGHEWDDFFNAPRLREEPTMTRGGSGQEVPERRQGTRTRDERRSSDRLLFSNGSGRRERHGDARGGPDDDRISHFLAAWLRYHMVEANEGWISMSQVLSEPELQGATEEDVKRVVLYSRSRLGRRFELREVETPAGKTEFDVRATYKHVDSEPRAYRMGRRGRRANYADFDSRPRDDGYPRCSGFSSSPTEANEQADADGLIEVKSFDEAEPKTTHHFNLSPRASEKGQERYDIEEEFAAFPAGCETSEKQAHVDLDDVPLKEASKNGATPMASDASASTASTASTQEEVWQRWLEPDSFRVWFWNPSTEEVLWADDLEDGWEMFFTEEGQRWFWQESSGRYFFEEADES